MANAKTTKQRAPLARRGYLFEYIVARAMWLFMMAASIGFPVWAACSWPDPDDIMHRLLFVSCAAPLVCLAMAFYFVTPSRKEANNAE